MTICIGGKDIHHNKSLHASPVTASFKVDDEDFANLSEKKGF